MNQTLFTTLFLRHRPDCIRFAVWLTRNTDEAEDLVQDAYCYALQRLEKIPEGDRAFVSWIFVGMRFLRQNRLRTQQREGAAYKRMRSAAENSLYVCRPDSDTNLRPYRLMVNDALRRLPGMYRTPLVLHEMMDVECGELSVIENIAEGTVKSRLYRGRKILRKRLAGLAREENFAVSSQPPEKKGQIIPFRIPD
ncbi:MAG: RNA polymerase sigma factor [Spirochaetota bacterium]|jgi:RNA polymerase sigma-70 factor (ECF subfamily)|nr:RNA polymerase sigma factor [Spirochaetota bacterium]